MAIPRFDTLKLQMGPSGPRDVETSSVAGGSRSHTTRSRASDDVFFWQPFVIDKDGGYIYIYELIYIYVCTYIYICVCIQKYKDTDI